MTNSNETMLLRIYTDESAHVGDRRLIDEIVRRARTERLAGATVLRGTTGFGGRKGAMHEHHSFGVGDNMPMVVEIVDAEPALRTFAASLKGLRHIGLMTLERVTVLAWSEDDSGDAS
jgi:PII-like signaling protein